MRRQRAVVVGIDRYLDPAIKPLSACASDAIAISARLRALGYVVTTLHDGAGGVATGKVTAARVRAAVRAVMRASKEEDVVVVYAACHGARFRGRPYLTMANTPATASGHRARGLALADLFAGLRGRTRRVAVFLDACAMGLGIDATVSATTQHIDDHGGGFGLLSGSRADGLSQDGVSGGAFTTAMLTGLDGGAVAADGAIRFADLARHVQAGVRAWRDGPVGSLIASEQAAVLRLEVADMELAPPYPFEELAPRGRRVVSAAMSSDGRLVATDAQSVVWSWDLAIRQVAWEWSLYSAPLDAQPGYEFYGGVALSPDGATVAVCAEGQLQLLAPRTGELLSGGVGVGPLGTAVAWSPTGRRVAVGARDGVHLFVVRGGRLVPERVVAGHATTVWSLAFTPDGSLVSGSEDGQVRVSRIPSGASVRQWTVDGPVWAVAVAPQGDLIATGGAGRSLKEPHQVQLWDRRTGARRQVLGGHGGGVTSLAFSPDGALLATACEDGAARLWRVADGRRLRSMAAVGSTPVDRPTTTAVAFSPDGTKLFVGFDDGRTRIYDNP